MGAVVIDWLIDWLNEWWSMVRTDWLIDWLGYLIFFQLGKADDLPETLPEDASTSEEFLRKFHHAILEVRIVQQYCGRTSYTDVDVWLIDWLIDLPVGHHGRRASLSGDWPRVPHPERHSKYAPDIGGGSVIVCGAGLLMIREFLPFFWVIKPENGWTSSVFLKNLLDFYWAFSLHVHETVRLVV